VRIVFVMFGAAAFVGCTADFQESQIDQRDIPVVADVVARIGGHSIGASEVESRMATEEVSAEAALEHLIDEALLIQEAERFGFAEDRDGERSVERLMVRTMLHDLEKDNTPESISEEEVGEAYALHAKKFQVPERRRSWHILVEEQGEAGKALAESILRELRQADDPRTVYDHYSDGGPGGLNLDVKAEDLPAITIQGNFKKAYKIALFAAESKGPLKKAVKTSYGWHAIVVAEILPGSVRTIDDAEEEIRELLSQKKRFAELVTIVQGLEAQGLVQYDDQGVERLLSMPGLPERAE
jgi:peptidyl-prolyl cis-trans isomerase C